MRRVVENHPVSLLKKESVTKNNLMSGMLASDRNSCRLNLLADNKLLPQELRNYDVIMTYSSRSTRHSTTSEKIKKTTFFIFGIFVFSPL